MPYSKKATLLVLVSLLHFSCTIFRPIPQPKIEFRGFWVATVANIDWPKSGMDKVEKQKTDFLNILDFYADLNFNAAIVQLRTAGDAFYASQYAPWSRYLTGEEGKAPELNGDLLSWMIAETHKRGMEFHAWLNPYRATFDLNTEILSPIHDYNLHPDWMIKYGNKYYYDPGLPAVRQRLVDVIDELVSRYDVDGIHFDDYFYPYTIANTLFQDSLTYIANRLPQQSLGDWRRSNIDSLVKNGHAIVKSRKPWVQFGISPFGVWKNKATDPMGSDTRAGQTTFENLYADPLLWIREGWLDYIVPQVYWSMELPVASHRKIVQWWAEHATNTNLYIGNGPYKIRNNSDKAWNRKKELPNQLLLARRIDAIKGNVFFSAKSLMQENKDVVAYLKRNYYQRKALSPASLSISNRSAQEIILTSIKEEEGMVNFAIDASVAFRYALVYAQRKSKKVGIASNKKLLAKIFRAERNHFILPKKLLRGKRQIAVTFVDRYGRESDPIFIHLGQSQSHGSKR